MRKNAIKKHKLKIWLRTGANKQKYLFNMVVELIDISSQAGATVDFRALITKIISSTSACFKTKEERQFIRLLNFLEIC